MGWVRRKIQQGNLPCIATGLHSKAFLPRTQCYFILSHLAALRQQTSHESGPVPSSIQYSAPSQPPQPVLREKMPQTTKLLLHRHSSRLMASRQTACYHEPVTGGVLCFCSSPTQGSITPAPCVLTVFHQYLLSYCLHVNKQQCASCLVAISV